MLNDHFGQMLGNYLMFHTPLNHKYFLDKILKVNLAHHDHATWFKKNFFSCCAFNYSSAVSLGFKTSSTINMPNECQKKYKAEEDFPDLSKHNNWMAKVGL